MRRQSLDMGGIRRQIFAVLTTAVRRRDNSINTNNNNRSIFSFARRIRRFSVPDKNHSDISNNNRELDAIDEVSKWVTVSILVYETLCYPICITVKLHEINFLMIWIEGTKANAHLILKTIIWIQYFSLIFRKWLLVSIWIVEIQEKTIVVV